jgi:hypothetical protein
MNTMCFHLIFELIPRKHELDLDTLHGLACLQSGGGFHRHIETDPLRVRARVKAATNAPSAILPFFEVRSYRIGPSCIVDVGRQIMWEPHGAQLHSDIMARTVRRTDNVSGWKRKYRASKRDCREEA